MTVPLVPFRTHKGGDFRRSIERHGHPSNRQFPNSLATSSKPMSAADSHPTCRCDPHASASCSALAPTAKPRPNKDLTRGVFNRYGEMWILPSRITRLTLHPTKPACPPGFPWHTTTTNSLPAGPKRRLLADNTTQSGRVFRIRVCKAGAHWLRFPKGSGGGEKDETKKENGENFTSEKSNGFRLTARQLRRKRKSRPTSQQPFVWLRAKKQACGQMISPEDHKKTKTKSKKN